MRYVGPAPVPTVILNEAALLINRLLNTKKYWFEPLKPVNSKNEDALAVTVETRTKPPVHAGAVPEPLEANT